MLTNNNIKLIPKLSKSKSTIKIDFDDISVSQVEYTEGPVGITLIIFKNPVKVYMDVRGGWPAYLNGLSTNTKQTIDGICLVGGSILGLEAVCGIMSETLIKCKNWKSINGAVIYSRNLYNNKIYPDKNLGIFAYNNLNNILYNGQVGAGQTAAKGQGWYYHKLNKIKILGLVVNNAIGDIYKNNKKIFSHFNFSEIDINKNTTLTVLITNLKLDNDELKQLSHQVHSSMAETIRPFNTFFDGDIFYACSTETIQNKYSSKDLIKFYMLCSNVIKKAIYNSLKK